MEMDLKHLILKNGFQVLELGSSPGSWVQYASRIVGEKGNVIAFDIKPLTIEIPKNVTFYQRDIYIILEDNLLKSSDKFDVILSDMAPNTTGNKLVDSGSSASLCEAVIEISRISLKPNGVLLYKIFQGPFYDQVIKKTKSLYKIVKFVKPKSSRSESKEIYILAKNK